MDNRNKTFDFSNAVLKQFFVLFGNIVVFVRLIKLLTSKNLGSSLADIFYELFPELLHDHGDWMLLPVQVGAQRVELGPSFA